MLAGLHPDSLARLRFPLGELTKAEVRELAADAGLAVARKRDSQDLCFLAGTRLPRFLERHGARLAGRARSGRDPRRARGHPLGAHRGAHAFTVGQRHGLGIGGGEPLYVLRTDRPLEHRHGRSPRGAADSTVAIRDVTLRRSGARVDAVKVRSRGAATPCRLAADPGPGATPRVEVRLEEPIERTAPGQIACLYAGDVIVGYGTVA